MDDAMTPVDDDELTRLALSADPHPAIDADAVPWHPFAGATSLLPEWYMPAALATRQRTGVKVAIGIIIASFVLVNALGLCITYGFITLA
jgi:hypothetical protein